MSVPKRDDKTNTEEIYVSWDAIWHPEDGNSVATSYSLEFDEGTKGEVWKALVGYLTDFTDLSTTVTESI
jgi:hypothetical protein